MKILVTGVGGQLGYDVMKVLRQRKIDCLGADIEDFDITDAAASAQFIENYAPDAVIHCSAYTAVDRAEEEADRCRQVNAKGPRNIAEACKRIGAKMVYVSTDYVFPGFGDRFYEVSDPTGPATVYGKTKLEGEAAVKELLDRYFIVRVSWVFGKNGNNFVKTMLRLGRERPEVSVVSDQIGSPTYTADLAPVLCDLVQTEQYGVYHATNEGVCSWADFAAEIFRLGGCKARVHPIPSSQYPAKAPRPLNSRLSKKSLLEAGFGPLPCWQDALARYLKEIGE